MRAAAPLPSVRLAVAALCLLVVITGAAFRLLGTNWDEGANLHPDERHMMFVVSDTLAAFKALKPGELSGSEIWFAAGKSPLDPRRQDRLYVYGEFPHIVVSLLSRAWDYGWPEALRLGRTLGAILDAYTILAVFLLAGLILRDPFAGLTAALFYAFLPMALQQADFFTVDVWLTAAGAWCLVAATLAVRVESRRAALAWFLLSGALAGLAFACKLPGLAFLGAAWVAAVVRAVSGERERRMREAAAALLVSTAAFAVVFRLASPFTFQGPGILGLAVTPNVLKGYREMSHLVLDFGFPPNWQWMTGYGPAQALRDLALWGAGPAVALAFCAGVVRLAALPRSWPALLPSLLLAASIAAYWLLNLIPALRYVHPALPAVCVIAAGAVPWARRRSAGLAVLVFVVAGAAVWAAGIILLHAGTNSRVAAARWLWLNTEPGTVLANESSWDDGLPVPVRLPGNKDLVWPGAGDHFTYLTLSLEWPDSTEKAARIAGMLDRADFVILSSERLRKPILAMPERFPMTSAYYGMLRSGALCFERAYRNRPGYPLLGFSLDDSGAQEPWSVYDHPIVEIYRKLPCFDRREVETKLVQALAAGK